VHLARAPRLRNSCPRRAAIAGFDDITTLRDITPALTTVRLPLDQIGSMALDLVITAKPGARPRIRRVKGEIVVRASTPPAGASASQLMPCRSVVQIERAQRLDHTTPILDAPISPTRS
jgi:hypothetical protein